jgi:hypothetical protein
MCILTRFSGAVEIFAPASTPPITGKTGSAFGVSFLLPLEPLVIGVVVSMAGNT